MGRLVLLSALAYSAIILGFSTLNSQLLGIAIPLIIFIAAGLLFSPSQIQLKVIRSLANDQIPPGKPIKIKHIITNQGSKLEEVQISNFIPPKLNLLEGERQVALSLAPGESLEIQHKITGKRGFYHFPDVKIIASDHLNLFRQNINLIAPAKLLVLPHSARLKQINIRPRHTRVFAGQIPTRLGGSGTDFFGVRNYQPGDPQRWIDWKTSARHPNKTFTKLFQQERAGDVGLILDARVRSDVAGVDETLFEYSIQATAALAESFLAAGNRVGLLIYGNLHDWTFPRYGKIQRIRIMQKLARTQTGDSKAFNSLDRIPTRLFPPKSQLVLISPLLKDDYQMLTRVMARGYQMMIISPDPVNFSTKQRGSSETLETAARIAHLERTLLLQKLRRSRIQILNWQVDTPFRQAAHAALSRTPHWLRSLGLGA